MSELSPISTLLDEAVTAGRVPGAVLVVESGGKIVHRSAHGVLDAGTGFPLRPDSVFWLASLSKVVGAVGLLQLAEDGALDIADPVSKHLPEFAAPGRVLQLRPGSPSPAAPPFGPPPDPLPEFDVVPAERELTLFDLLTHTGGLQSLLRWNPEFVTPAPGRSLADYASGLATLPRDFQAGRGWAYSNAAAFDVLSRVIEVASGQDLADHLTARVLEPLGMDSVGFGRGDAPGAAPVPGPMGESPVVRGNVFRSTSAGLWGTGEDYLKLARMLRRHGELDGKRLLTADSVTRMTTNRIGELCPGLNGREPAPGVGFGFAVAVVEDPAAAGESLPPGSFGWDGIGTRRFWVAPTADWSLFCYAPDVAVQRDIEAVVTAALG